MKVFFSSISHPSTTKARLLALLLATVAVGASRAADDFWINTGTLTEPPQIDATNFINSGEINISTTLPFETSDTLNYTNSGTMFGTPGFEFDFAPPNAGFRFPAANFVNLNTGDIESLDNGGLIIFTTNNVLGASAVTPSYLWVNATNIINKGTLAVGGAGWLKITGTNVDVSRSALAVTALQPTGGLIVGQTNYLNDVGIQDVWWGQTNLTFNSASVWNGTTATAPPHPVQRGPGGPFLNASFSIVPQFVFGYSNSFGGESISLTNSDGSTTNFFLTTNVIEQAVFVSISDPSAYSVNCSFFPSSTITNPFRTVSIQLALLTTNVITQQLDANTLYFHDTLASETNRGFMINLASTALPPYVFERPANYELARIDDGRFFNGIPGNFTPGPTSLFDPTTFTNRFVAGEYAGYQALIDNLASEPPPIGPGGVTNFPGRVQLFGDSVNLQKTRVRGEGEVIVKANHLLSSAGAAVDCENLSYDLGATNGNLRVVNLTKLSVDRMKGPLLAWSGLWSNQATIVFTNNFVVTNTTDTNGVITGTNAVASPLTNTVSVGLYALILDGNALLAHVPVTTWDLVTRSTNIVVSDAMNLVESLVLDGQSFTLNGTINLTSKTLVNYLGQSATTELLNWFATNAPGLLYFTNNGTLTVPSEAHFGDDRPVPYSDYVNTGTLRVGSLDVASTYIENDGNISATVGPLNLVGQVGKFQGGSTVSSGDLNLTFSDVKFLNHSISAIGTLNFNATDALSDAGAGSGNTFTVNNGFSLLVKPNTGDLLGTTINDAPPSFVEVDHVWAAQDRGASAAGYSDNVAIGRLTLTAQSIDPTQAPLFFFTGTNGQRAMYVDLLDLSSLSTNYQDILEIDPSLTIYYAAAKLGFTPPPNASGIPQEPEEFLNGQFGGHLVWVSSFAGPNSSTAVIVNGQTVLMNTALRNSKIIDSDGDGIPNFFDSTPLGGSGGPVTQGVTINGNFNAPASQQVFSLNFNAAANTAYRIEMTTDLAHPNWQLVTTYTNTSPATANVTISDNNNVIGPQRFYRVRVMQ